jgi:hypothetical protein
MLNDVVTPCYVATIAAPLLCIIARCQHGHASVASQAGAAEQLGASSGAGQGGAAAAKGRCSATAAAGGTHIDVLLPAATSLVRLLKDLLRPVRSAQVARDISSTRSHA